MLGTVNRTVLSELESGRVSRTCARLAVSCVLFFREALPKESFYPGCVDGVLVPLLNKNDKAGKYLVELLEAGVMPAVKDEKVSAIKVCIYCDQSLAESYDVVVTRHEELEQSKVPGLITSLKADIIDACNVLDPLPPCSSISVGLRVAYNDNIPHDYALPGFNLVKDTVPLGEDIGITVSHEESGCEVRVAF